MMSNKTIKIPGLGIQDVNQQQPVAWALVVHEKVWRVFKYKVDAERMLGAHHAAVVTPLYAAPPAPDAEDAARLLDLALGMLAEWCVAISVAGSSWDDWDSHYKGAMYRPGPLRDLLDKAITEAMQSRAEWDKRAAEQLRERADAARGSLIDRMNREDNPNDDEYPPF